MQKKWKQLLACLAAPLAAGGLSAWLEGHESLQHPA